MKCHMCVLSFKSFRSFTGYLVLPLRYRMEPMSIGRTVLTSQMSATARAMPAVFGLKTPKMMSDQVPRMAILATGMDGKMATTI